ncbi:MAG: PDZ domain-containing protein, partial [Gemmiger qucibialis]
LGTLRNTVTNGIVSALNREVTVQGNYMNLIQTSASISPGNSGGGLFNANGELIGIVNAKSSSSDAEGLGFAIPINTAMEMAKQMIEKGYVARPAMGVTVITINDAQTAMQYGVSNYGVYIYQIASGSGAEKGGLKLGDRIISIDDVAVSSASDVQKYCQSKEVGDTVTLQVERDGKVISCEVTLGESTQSTATAESGN